MGPVSPHKAQRPTEGREIMYAEFTGAVGCCCRAGGRTSLEQNDSCIEMRRLPGGYFSRAARWLETWGEWTPVICRAMTARLLCSDERRRNETGVVRNKLLLHVKAKSRLLADY